MKSSRSSCGRVCLRPARPFGPRDGAVLGLAMLVVLLVSILGVGLLRLSEMNAVEVAKSVSAEHAFWAAEAGLAHARAIGIQAIPFDEMVPSLVGSNVITGTTGHGAYSVDIVDVSQNANVERHYEVTSHGTSAGGVKSTLRSHAALQVLGASYAMATGMETTPDGKRNFYGWYDWIDGPVYANSQFNIVGPAQQAGGNIPLISWGWIAASVADSVYYAGNIKNDNTIFWHPTDSTTWPDDPVLGVPPINICACSNLYENWRSNAVAIGTVTQGTVYISFETNKVRISGTPTGTNATVRAIMPGDWNYYLVQGNVAGVQGVLQGKVVLLATNTISITSNILYISATGANDPWLPSFDTNLVQDGLVMATPKEIVVEADPKKVSQVDVHSSIVVHGDADSPADPLYGFCARNNSIAGAGAGQPVIRVYGTMVQFRRGLTGPPPSGASDEPPPNKGFGLHLKFDPRFVWEGLLENNYSAYWWSQWRQVPQ